MDDVADTADTSPTGTPVKGRRPPPPRRTSSPPPEYGIARAEPIDVGRFEPALHVMSIGPSPFNRKVDTHKLDDLIESIRQHGVINPITVRPTKTLAGIIQYEVVAGERRWRASEPAGRTTIPAIVRELADDQVVEIQLIENARRENLHPLEEADIYARLLALPGYTEDRVAERTGTKLSHVRERLRLTKLTPKVRDLFATGKFGLEVALLIGRMPAIAELQDQAADEIAVGEDDWVQDDDGRGVQTKRAMTIREARDVINARFMTRLERATWKLDDAELVPSAGACSTCPKRTGNQAELFADVKSPDVCTDPTCFRSKTDAQFKRAADEARKAGLRVLPQKEAKQVFGDHVSHDRGVTALNWQSPLVDVADKLGYGHGAGIEVEKKTWTALLKDVPNAPPVVIAKDPNTGAPRELIDKDAALKALRKAGVLKAERSTSPSPAVKAREAAKRTEEEIEDAARARVLGALAVAKVPAKVETAWWRTVVKLIAITRDEGIIDVGRRRGWPSVTYSSQRSSTIKQIDKLQTVADLRGLLAEVLVADAEAAGNMTGDSDEWKLVETLCKLLGVDRKAHLEAARKAAEVEAKVPADKKAGAKKGGRR